MKYIAVSLLTILICACSTKTEPRVSIYATQYDSCVENLGTKENFALRDRVLDLDKLNATKPLITADQIKSYNWKTHEVELTKGTGKLLPRPDSFGIPILIMVNGEKAYVAAIWTHVSSCATDLPVIDWWDAQDDLFRIKLGYPVERTDNDLRKYK